jgi:hypothetical protein
MPPPDQAAPRGRAGRAGSRDFPAPAARSSSPASAPQRRQASDQVVDGPFHRGDRAHRRRQHRRRAGPRHRPQRRRQRLVYVRGLGDRYSLALLNGSPLPSPEPLRRVVPLDIFPSGVIASSLVQKSYSVNYPGEFGGGVINLTTKSVPRDAFVTISAGGTADTETTGRFGYSYFGAKSDWTGFDDGSRDFGPALTDLFQERRGSEQRHSAGPRGGQRTGSLFQGDRAARARPAAGLFAQPFGRQVIPHRRCRTGRDRRRRLQQQVAQPRNPSAILAQRRPVDAADRFQPGDHRQPHRRERPCRPRPRMGLEQAALDQPLHPRHHQAGAAGTGPA